MNKELSSHTRSVGVDEQEYLDGLDYENLLLHRGRNVVITVKLLNSPVALESLLFER